MKQNNCKLGDFLVNSQFIWEIINISDDSIILLPISNPGDFLETDRKNLTAKDLKKMTFDEIKFFGKIIPKEESEKVIELLFSRNEI